MNDCRFSLEAVRRSSEANTRPLEVQFEAYGKCWRFYCSGSDLQTFDRFQIAALERCGVWLPPDEILSAKPRDAKREWSSFLAAAVGAGEGH